MHIIYLILEKLIPFSFIEHNFMKNAILAVLLIAPLFGILGTMAVNNSMAFFSDALGHSALTGIAVGILFGQKNHLISMIAFGVVLSLLITKVKRAKTSSADTVIGVFSAASVALGLFILSMGGNFNRYSQYIIGDILSITPFEIGLLAIVLALVLIIWAKIWNKLLLISINEGLASSRGINTALIENIFVVIVSVVVMLSIKWIGMLLINSLLILPAAASRNIAKNTRQYLFGSLFIAIFSSISGLILSYYLNASAGSTIVIICTVIFFITYAFRKK